MNIYLITKNSIQLPQIQIFTLQNGISIPAILMGEKGRGRKLSVIPIKNLNYNPDTTLYLKQTELTLTKSGNLALEAIEVTGNPTPNTSIPNTDFLTIIESPYSFRGIGKIQNESNYNILEKAYYAQGDAGRMGTTYIYLLSITKNNLPITLTTSGRTYNNHDTFVLSNINNNLSILPINEYNLL